MSAKILIVDDSAVSAKYFKDILVAEEHNVITSNSGADVISVISANDIDIVLLDVIMPDIDGYEVLKILQESDNTRDIPVIMITSLTSSLDVKKALDCGALDFIRKTCEPIEVIARIHSALRLKKKHDQLKENSQRDSLTMLYNKSFLNVTLEKLIKIKKSFANGIAFLIMDCDFFKRINDNYGHMFGDMVLASVAATIDQSVRRTDFPCRFGGEEFCVIFPDTTLSEAYLIAERIRTNVESLSFNFQGKSVSITVSCGISHMERDDGKNGLRLVGESDTALYRAKNNGRNQSMCFFEH